MIFTKDFYFGGQDTGIRGMYFPPRFRLPKDFKQGDKIDSSMFSPIPMSEWNEGALPKRPIDLNQYDEDGWELYDHDLMKPLPQSEIDKHPNRFMRGGSRPRPTKVKPRHFLQNYEPVHGQVSWNEGEGNIPAADEFTGVNLSERDLKKPIGDEEDLPHGGLYLDDMTDYEPDLPKILQTLLHEQVHRATFEDIQRQLDTGEIDPRFLVWAHEFAANSLQRPGGTHDKDTPSFEREQAHRDSFMHRPMPNIRLKKRGAF
tara:strand:+ start:507 stop:1283 length:777 start_codon:yes stop_codon:yes gene_type:complete